MIASLVLPMAAASIDLSKCTQAQHVLDFIVLEGDAEIAAVEDDIRTQLAAVHMTVNTRMLPKDQLNPNMTSGNFNMVFSETWGPPYDPHSFAASWLAPDEGHYPAMDGLQAPQDKAWLTGKINAVLSIENEVARQAAWTEILSATHGQAIDLPLYGKRIPAVVNDRLSSYRNGLQQYDYPFHTLRVESGSTTITVSPGGQAGLFRGVGRLDAHSYRPNEFWANNMVYESLVEYGPGGQILPALALSWTVADTTTGGQRYSFNLRTGVTFHDGDAWNCNAAKMNFDNVLHPNLRTGDWHGWYKLMDASIAIESWSCPSAMVFEVVTKTKYYPLLQELSYIRPLRFISPSSFVGGLANDPVTQNSCPPAWGTAVLNGVTVTCAGQTKIAGTGRWQYVNTVREDGVTVVQTGVEQIPSNGGTPLANSVTMNRFANHWEGAAARQVETIRFVRYADHAAVKAALLDGSLDMVVGSGPLTPTDIKEFLQTRQSTHTTYLTEPIINKNIILNAAKAPTDSLEVRKIIIHAIDKASIIDRELSGLSAAVDTLFPKDAPYCNIDLTPRWDYDLEKVKLLACTLLPTALVGDTDDDLAAGWIALIVIASVIGAAAVGVVIWLIVQEKAGKPVFAPIPEQDEPAKDVATTEPSAKDGHNPYANNA